MFISDTYKLGTIHLYRSILVRGIAKVGEIEGNDVGKSRGGVFN